MAAECRVRIEAEDEETAWVGRELHDAAGRRTASGRVAYDLETVHFYWEDGRPPHEDEALVRTAIDRAIRGRAGAAR